MRALYIAAIATLFATSVLATTVETAEEEFASRYYIAQSSIYGGYKTEGLSFYASCEYERLPVAVSTSGQSRYNGTALRTQFAPGPLRLAIPVRLGVSDMEAYAVGDMEPRARLYALLHAGTPIAIKVTGVDPQPLQLLQLSPRNADTGARQLEVACPVSRRADQ